MDGQPGRYITGLRLYNKMTCSIAGVNQFTTLSSCATRQYQSQLDAYCVTKNLYNIYAVI